MSGGTRVKKVVSNVDRLSNTSRKPRLPSYEGASVNVLGALSHFGALWSRAVIVTGGDYDDNDDD